MSTNTIILFAAFINILVLVIYFVFNRQLILKNSKKSSHNEISSFEVETKTNIRFLFMASSLVLPILIFLGVNSLNDAKESIEGRVTNDLQVIDSYKDSVSIMNDTLAVVLKSFDKVRKEIDSIDMVAKQTQQEIGNKQSSINAIENRLSLQTKQISDIKNFVFLNPIMFNENSLDKIGGERKLYFKDATTLSGLELPKFESPPRVIQVNTDIDVVVKKVTTEMIQYHIGGYMEVPDSTHEIQFLIFY